MHLNFPRLNFSGLNQILLLSKHKQNTVMSLPQFYEDNDLWSINQVELSYKDKIFSTHNDMMGEESLKIVDYSCFYESQQPLGAYPLEEPDKIKFIQQEDYVNIVNNDSVFSYQSQIQVPLQQIFHVRQKTKSKKIKKNSNIIKKIGRIIIQNINRYQLPNEKNTAKFMLSKLQNRTNIKDKGKNQKDEFNTSDLQVLYGDEKTSSFNLKTTRKIFTQKLRKDVLSSYQIKKNNKVMYLNSLKCSCLRFMNKKLAVRLQISSDAS